MGLCYLREQYGRPEGVMEQIRPKLKRDLEQAEFVDRKLQEAFDAFMTNQKDKGRKAILAVYNLNVKQFR